MGVKRVLVLGDNKRFMYHPLTSISGDLPEILGNDYSVEFTEDSGALLWESLMNFDLFVSYSDNWDVKLSKEEVSGIIKFIAEGSGFLVIHTGIAHQKNHEIAQLIGAKFTGHPPYDHLLVRTTSRKHPITDGIDDFEIDDEPYQFVFDPFVERTDLLEYVYKGEIYPAAWAVEYGVGRIVYLMPGHDNGPFKNESYRRVIRRSADWAVKEL